MTIPPLPMDTRGPPMTLDEAMESSQEAVVFLATHHQLRLSAAVRLGIEALKFFKEFQKLTISRQDARLPGETEGS